MELLSSEKERLISLIEAYDKELKEFKITSLKKRVELQKKKKELEKKYNEMKPAVESQKRRKKELEQKIKQLRQQLQASSTNRERIESEHDEILKHLDGLRDRVTSLRERAEALEQEVAELRQRKEELTKSIEYLQKEIPRRTELKSKLQSLSKRMSHLNAEKERYEEQLQEKERILSLLNKLHELQNAIKSFIASLDWVAWTLNQISLDEIVAPLDLESRKRVVKALQLWENALGAYKGREYAVLFQNLIDAMHEILDLYLEFLGLVEKVRDPSNIKEKIIILTNYAVPISSRHVDTVYSFLERMNYGIEVLPKMGTVVDILQTFERNLLVLCSLPKELRFSE